MPENAVYGGFIVLLQNWYLYTLHHWGWLTDSFVEPLQLYSMLILH